MFLFFRDDLLTKLSQESSSLKKMIGLPLSIYFDAFRTEDYETGGEEYLTFTDCHTNLGKEYALEKYDRFMLKYWLFLGCF